MLNLCLKRQPWFAYIACGLFSKKKEIIQKIKETGDSRYIYQNNLDKACFQHDMVYVILKMQLEERILIKYCVIKHLILLKIRNMMNIKEVLLQ